MLKVFVAVITYADALNTSSSQVTDDVTWPWRSRPRPRYV